MRKLYSVSYSTIDYGPWTMVNFLRTATMVHGPWSMDYRLLNVYTIRYNNFAAKRFGVVFGKYYVGWVDLVGFLCFGGIK